MEKHDDSQPLANAVVTTRGKPRKGEVKLSIVNMCGPSSADILGQIYQQAALPQPVNSQNRVLSRKPWPYVPRLMGFAPVPAVDKNLFFTNESRPDSVPPLSPVTVQIGSSVIQNHVIHCRAGMCGQRVRARLCSLRLVDKLGGPTVKHCQGIQPICKFILSPKQELAVIP